MRPIPTYKDEGRFERLNMVHLHPEPPPEAASRRTHNLSATTPVRHG
jgi:hypothetical protein